MTDFNPACECVRTGKGGRMCAPNVTINYVLPVGQNMFYEG